MQNVDLIYIYVKDTNVPHSQKHVFDFDIDILKGILQHLNEDRKEKCQIDEIPEFLSQNKKEKNNTPSE